MAGEATYVPIPETARWEPIAGVGPWRELSEAEFAELNESVGGGLERWYERVETKKGRAARAAGGDDR